tara:strand:+ start:386 stop:514 length:129 start_codon:yes stop_codon:yes gene_type:complete
VGRIARALADVPTSHDKFASLTGSAAKIVLGAAAAAALHLCG